MDPVAMLAAYARERFGCDTELEPDKGFATWKLTDLDGRPTVYLVDIYVAPDFRRFGVGSELADRVAAKANARGATQMLGSVETKSATATDALGALLASGFRVSHVEGSMVYFLKEIA